MRLTRQGPRWQRVVSSPAAATLTARRPLLLLALAAAARARQYYPLSQACTDPAGWPALAAVCDTSQPFAARAAALTALLTPQEKAAWLQNGQAALPRLNLSSWEFGAEALHGLQGNCITAPNEQTGLNVTRCPSSFPAGPALGSSFNRSLLHFIGEQIGDEVRATVNLNVPRAYGGELLVPSVWMPNLNVLRDPRWGRNQEAFSEDPYVIGTLGALLVHGTARGVDGFGAKYLKVIVISKHATGYQIENDRFGYNPNFTPHDIASTYLQAWELAASKATPGQGGFNGYMCAYDSIFGLPMCLSDWFKPLMVSYGLDPGASYVQGDCAAVKHSQRGVAKNFTWPQIAGWILNNSAVDKECGGILFLGPNALPAIAANLTNMTMLDASISRALTLQFQTGRFDPVEGNLYTSIGFEAMDAPRSRQLATEAALQGATLLRNDAGALPFPTGRKVACIGPFCNVTSDLLGNYWSIRCAGAAQGTNPCIPTFLQGLSAANPGGAVSYTFACDVNNPLINDTAGAVAAARAADLVVLSFGANQATCQEGVDRNDMSVPGAFMAVAAEVLAVGRPTVVVFTAGGALGFDALARYSGPTPLAIVWAPYPGEMGFAPLATQLFAGGPNRWGKLPLTLYENSYTTLVKMTDMSMAPNASTYCCDYTCQTTCGPSPGRTYKFFSGPVLYPFAHGLSYTTFSLSGSCNVTATAPQRAGAGVACSVNITNTGALAGDEVVVVYAGPSFDAGAAGGGGGGGGGDAMAVARAAHGLSANDPLALKQVVDFGRVSLAPGASETLSFELPFAKLAQADAAGRLLVRAGEHALRFSRGNAAEDLVVRVRVGRDALVREAPAFSSPAREAL